MDAVDIDLNHHLSQIDHQESLAAFVEPFLEETASSLKDQLDSTGVFSVSGFGDIDRHRFIQFLTLEEFHPEQGFRWLALKQLIWSCQFDDACLACPWEVIKYCEKQGYC